MGLLRVSDHGTGSFMRQAQARPPAPPPSRRPGIVRATKEVRIRRKENVPGDVYVDHTCIGTIAGHRGPAVHAPSPGTPWEHFVKIPPFLRRKQIHTSLQLPPDCDTCRWMAPSVFGRVGDMSAVMYQPATAEERQRALEATISCPTCGSVLHSRMPALNSSRCVGQEPGAWVSFGAPQPPSSSETPYPL